MGAVSESTHQCFEPGVAQERYSRQPTPGTGTSTGRSKDSQPNAVAMHLGHRLEGTPSDERATTTDTPRPSVSGRRTR